MELYLKKLLKSKEIPKFQSDLINKNFVIKMVFKTSKFVLENEGKNLVSKGGKQFYLASVFKFCLKG